MEQNTGNNGGVQTGISDAPVVSTPVVAPQPLPDNVSDRTSEQFQKLLQSNQNLYNEIQTLKKAQQTVTQPQAQPQANQQINMQDFIEIDPNTGERFINEQRLQSKISDLDQMARRAEQKAERFYQTYEDREIERQNKEAFTSYPELNPRGEKFDQVLHKQVRALITDSMMNPADYGGRALEFKEAADLVRSLYPKAEAKPQPETTTQDTQNSIQEKLQATADLQSTPQRNYVPSNDPELEYLRKRTRAGDDQALAKRLMGTEHIVTSDTVKNG